MCTTSCTTCKTYQLLSKTMCIELCIKFKIKKSDLVTFKDEVSF